MAEARSLVRVLRLLPTVAVLLFYRRPWSVAAAAALATPIFYTQSIILLLPAIRLWLDDGGRELLARRTRPARVPAARAGRSGRDARREAGR